LAGKTGMLHLQANKCKLFVSWVWVKERVTLKKQIFMTAAKIENEIYNYVHGFSLEQKKAVLTAVKEIAEEKDESGYSEEFKRELDNRYADYLAGAETLTQQDIDKETRRIIMGDKK